VRIIHLANHCRFGHGNVHAAVDLACAQAAAGDTVVFASGPGEFSPLLVKHGVDSHLLDQESRKPWAVARMVWQLTKLIRDFRPDIVHAHMMTGAGVGWLSTRGKSIGLVTTVHNAFDSHSIIMGVGDQVIAVSQAVEQRMAKRGISRSKLRTVLNGTLGAPRRNFFTSQRYELQHPNIATLCGLHERKGVRDLIAAFEIVGANNQNVHLYIGGDGPDRSAYEVLADATKVSNRIHFLGEILDTISFLNSVDIFVLASHADPAPLVLPEAREAGCAIVATAVDGIPELLEGGAAGILTPPKDPAALASALDDLLDDPSKLENMKFRAVESLDYWSTSRVAAQTREVYAECMVKRRGG
jgi:glycosyltransferase involved in cell wall biosynthesis